MKCPAVRRFVSSLTERNHQLSTTATLWTVSGKSREIHIFAQCLLTFYFLKMRDRKTFTYFHITCFANKSNTLWHITFLCTFTYQECFNIQVSAHLIWESQLTFHIPNIKHPMPLIWQCRYRGYTARQLPVADSIAIWRTGGIRDEWWTLWTDQLQSTLITKRMKQILKFVPMQWCKIITEQSNLLTRAALAVMFLVEVKSLALI